MKRAIFLLALALSSGALAQQSPSFKLEEHALNAGGHPQDGTVLTSASFRLTLGAIGEIVTAVDPSSASFSLTAGFTGSYPPSAEVANVRFTNATTLVWDAERSVGVYNLYQGSVTNPFDPNYGLCQAAGIPVETVSVSSVPPRGRALFILVTAENRLAEEGPKGSDSAGSPRDNSNPCP